MKQRGERESESRRRVGGGTVHFVVHLQAGNVNFSFLCFIKLDTECDRVVILL